MAEDTGILALLASRATVSSRVIYNAFRGGRLKPADLACYRAAHEIAARLHLIHQYLGSLPPFCVELDVEQLCHKVLFSLDAISRPTVGPARSSPFNWAYATDLETNVINFFKTQTQKSEQIRRDCDILLEELTKGGNDIKELPKIITQHLDTPDTSLDDLNNGAFNALQSIAECQSMEYKTCRKMATSEEDSKILRHPARLCLHELRASQEMVARDMTVLVSAMGMTFWQEFNLMM
jgi:hypothetical protein